MKKDPRPYLTDILESIKKVEEYLKAIDEKTFSEDTQLQDAVVRRLEITGEAAKNLSKDFRNKYPEIPWKKMAGMRDILIHEYFGVNIKRVWRISQKDLPGLKEKISKILKEIE